MEIIYTFIWAEGDELKCRQFHHEEIAIGDRWNMPSDVWNYRNYLKQQVLSYTLFVGEKDDGTGLRAWSGISSFEDDPTLQSKRLYKGFKL